MPRLLCSLALALSFAFLGFAEDKPKPQPKSPEGLWLGILKVGPISLRMAFQIDKGKDDKRTGKLISIDEGMVEVPFDKVLFDDGKLTLEGAKGGIVYKGKLGYKGLTGELTLGKKTTLPLDLGPVAKLPSMNRPQTPKKPYPYPSNDVTFENESAKIELAGTLTLPKGDGPFPAVVLVSGSGPQDRDESIFLHKPFLVLADHFARNGIATLRYDDRGFGKSKGTFVGATTKDFATDAEAAVAFLKKQKKIDPKRIGICGHSEGGIIAPLVAVSIPNDVAFIVLLAGPGIPGEQLMHEQAKDFSKLVDAKADDKEAKELVEAVLPIMKSDATTEEAQKKLKAALEKFIDREKDEKKRKEFLENQLPLAVHRLSDPWLRWFIGHDPATTLKKVKCRVLAINGAKDIQVKSKQNLEAIAAALKAGGNKECVTISYPNLNHLFQTCKTGAFDEYGQIEETIAPAVLKRLSEWIATGK